MEGERQIPVGPALSLAGALLLAVSLGFDWYGTLSGWTVFEVLDLVLAALALGMVLLMLAELGLGLPERSAERTRPRALAIAGLALLIVLSQLVNHPPAGIDRDPELGLWLALGGSLLMLVGVLVATARISLALDVQRRDRGREEPAPPAAMGETDPDAPTVAQPRPGETPPP